MADKITRQVRVAEFPTSTPLAKGPVDTKAAAEPAHVVDCCDDHVAVALSPEVQAALEKVVGAAGKVGFEAFGEKINPLQARTDYVQREVDALLRDMDQADLDGKAPEELRELVRTSMAQVVSMTSILWATQTQLAEITKIRFGEKRWAALEEEVLARIPNKVACMVSCPEALGELIAEPDYSRGEKPVLRAFVLVPPNIDGRKVEVLLQPARDRLVDEMAGLWVSTYEPETDPPQIVFVPTGQGGVFPDAPRKRLEGWVGPGTLFAQDKLHVLFANGGTVSAYLPEEQVLATQLGTGRTFVSCCVGLARARKDQMLHFVPRAS